MGLPLRMDNIHAPTVPSGPSSRPLTNGSAAQLSFAELQLKKDTLEAELKALSGVLDSVGSPRHTIAMSGAYLITNTAPSMALTWTLLLRRRTDSPEQIST